MAELTLHDLSKRMKGIDFAMFSTKTEGGEIASRPMSNNGDVEYDGDSWFFTYESYRTVSDIERDPKVSLSMTGSKGLLGKPPIFISVEGHAELIRDKAEFEAHWTKDLDYWFENGVDTPGMVLIKVHASRVHYWDGRDEGEIVVR
ncbi:pyridoxamine 5'-phosphate oxidase family protein [Aureimonas ureilytica]|uniref:pyridoxamine 5'-phosphate oxidase family protein n=1 Tax=Aureimonas ureilytica TaxID=401562 RepID=UPI0003739387|nr:pyridoxamine 5'-phosphate oxidase family protein [Aureimonas ureilytica]